MSSVEQRLWPWQFKRTEALGAKVYRWFKILFLWGAVLGFPVVVLSLMPFIDQYIGDMYWGLAGYSAKALLVIVVVLATVAYSTLAERRFAALFQLRHGPIRVGWFGFLQPVADGLKFLFKEDVVLGKVHKVLYIAAPMMILAPAITVFAVMPFGPGETGANPFQLAHVNIGLLFILALSSLGVYGIAIGGWASYSKWSLLGGLRASAQMISYEVSLGLAVLGVLMNAESLDLVTIVNNQIDSAPLLGFIPHWNVFVQPLGFILFFVAVFAETNRLPFDLAEAEQELVGGYHTEYSSMKFAMFFLAEYANMVVASCLLTVLFLGGWNIPGFNPEWFPPIVSNALQIFAFFTKVNLILIFFIWVRWTLPRFRYDQLMKLGWLILLPVALANVIITAVVMAFV